MEGLLGISSGGGGGSASTVSKEDNLGLSSEESSSYPDESELELGLGLSLGGGLKAKQAVTSEGGSWGQYGRILTAKDFPSMNKSPSSLSSSSSSSSSMTKVSFPTGTKRTADSVSSNQVVGWPPIRAYRMNSLANQAKVPTTEEFHSKVEKTTSKKGTIITESGSQKNNTTVKEKGQQKNSLFVKVNMDGFPIGRKVDLNAHRCYETLAQALEDMFCGPTTTGGLRRPSKGEYDAMTEATGPASKLLDGSSDFVLTYEDKDGDWMLVGDVPWGMFIVSVKRLRIMRTSEANGLGPNFQERNGRESKPI